MSAIGELSAARRSTPAGFTLIEMLVVLAILGLVLAIVFPAVEKAMRGQEFATSTMRVELGLRSARADAIRNGRTAGFTAAPDGHAFAYPGEVERVPASSRISLSGRGLRFFADGSADGGAVTLRDGARMRSWTVDPSTGAIGRAP
jgi:general secretion pathway protein H